VTVMSWRCKHERRGGVSARQRGSGKGGTEGEVRAWRGCREQEEAVRLAYAQGQQDLLRPHRLHPDAARPTPPPIRPLVDTVRPPLLVLVVEVVCVVCFGGR
jgi:hypothetical protein